MPNSVKLRKVLLCIQKLGFVQVRQKGSHVFFEHPDGRTTLIPFHPEIHIKLLTKIVKQDLKMTREEFLKILENV